MVVPQPSITAGTNTLMPMKLGKYYEPTACHYDLGNAVSNYISQLYLALAKKLPSTLDHRLMGFSVRNHYTDNINPVLEHSMHTLNQ